MIYTFLCNFKSTQEKYIFNTKLTDLCVCVHEEWEGGSKNKRKEESALQTLFP